MWELAILAGLAYLLWPNDAGANTAPASPQDFINRFIDQARLTAVAGYVPVIFQLAQAALESNWGKSDIALNANNYFGIKADSAWQGDIYKGYRKYASPADSFTDHAIYLHQNARYKSAFNYADDPVAFATAVAGAGYATDFNYLPKMLDLIAQVGNMTKQAA